MLSVRQATSATPNFWCAFESIFESILGLSRPIFSLKMGFSEQEREGRSLLLRNKTKDRCLVNPHLILMILT